MLPLPLPLQAVLIALMGGADASGAALLERVDHLVYAAPDLDAAIDLLEKRLGVRAAPGGRHPGRGTRNALIALGPTSYLEILAPDPSQPRTGEPLWFGVGDLKEPRLVTWAAKARDLDRFAADAKAKGVAFGEIRAGSRRRTDGVLLSWRTVEPEAAGANGIVPFFIDWGDSPHPAKSAPAGVRLTALEAEHPDPRSMREILDRLGLPLAVRPGAAAALTATLETPRGRVALR